MCLYPKIIENRRYVANKKNGGVIPTFYDIREKYVEVVDVGSGDVVIEKDEKCQYRDWETDRKSVV